MRFDRRTLLAGAGAAALARPALAQSERSRVLRFIPYADLNTLDTLWTTVDITRDHGYLVYDTLYGADETLAPRPQLAEGHVFEQDNRVCTITLRSGIRFHDGTPIRAQDCVASLRRWMVLAPMGQTVAAVTDELAVLDDRRFRFRLRQPFPVLISILGQVVAPVPVIMPERIAQTPPDKQVTDATGSGPFRYKADEHQAGNLVVYERFADYVPTPDAGKGLVAGPKVAHFDRVEWHRIPDPSTAGAALQRNEMDWFGDPPPEMLELLARSRNIEVGRMELLPAVAVMRLNALHPVFSDKRMRQALLPAIDQSDFMIAAVGTDTERYEVGTGFFPPGSPSASDAALEPLKGPRDLAKAKRLFKEAGYSGQPVRLLGNAGAGVTGQLALVAADLFRRLDLNLDLALLESTAVAQRRRSMEPVERGGWSVSCWSFPGLMFENPATHILLRGNGKDAWFGWPTIPRLEELRDAWLAAPDAEAQKRIAREMQVVGMDELPCIPLGVSYKYTALSRSLTGRVAGLPIFWNIRRT